MDHRLAYLVVGIYLLLMIGVGLVMRHLNKDDSDYFRSGCKGTWWLVGSSAFMGAFSAWTFSGAAGSAFEAGWSVAGIYLANTVGFILNALWLAPMFRQMRAITVPQVIRQRFSPTTQQFYAWINVVLGVIYSALWLYGLAIFVAASFGFDIEVVVIVVGLVVLIYSVTGGSWAVMSSDFLQALVLIPITLLMAYLSLRAVGGWSGFLEQTQRPELAGDFHLINPDPTRFSGQYTAMWMVAMLLKNVIGYNTINSSVRYFSVKDGKEASKAAWLGAVLMTAGAVIWIIPPMVGRMLFADEINAMAIAKPAESAYAIVSLKLLPPALVGLMVVAMLAATMSSMDQGLNRNAAIFTRDIYPMFCRLLGRRPVEGKALMRRGQFFSLMFGIIIILITLYFTQREGEGVFEHMLTLGAVLALPLSVPMLLAIFIKRAPSWAAIASVAVASVPSAIGLLNHWPFQQQVFVNLAVGAGTYLLTMPWWRYEKPAYRAQVEAFFEQMHRPVDFAREVGPGNDLHQLTIIGRFAVGLGLLIALLLFIPGQSLTDRLSELFVSGFVASIGGLLMLGGRRRPVAVPPAEPETPAQLGLAKSEDGA
jgi:SSS family transporter